MYRSIVCIKNITNVGRGILEGITLYMPLKIEKYMRRERKNFDFLKDIENIHLY